MSFGFPPKYNIVHQFNNIEHTKIIESSKQYLIENGFDIKNNSNYGLQAVKKMRLTVIGAISFSGRAYMNISILVTEDGRFTLESKYDYNSYTASLFTDLGRQKKVLSPIIKWLDSNLIMKR